MYKKPKNRINDYCKCYAKEVKGVMRWKAKTIILVFCNLSVRKDENSICVFPLSGSVRSNRVLTAKDRDDLTNALKIDPVNKFHMESILF